MASSGVEPRPGLPAETLQVSLSETQRQLVQQLAGMQTNLPQMLAEIQKQLVRQLAGIQSDLSQMLEMGFDSHQERVDQCVIQPVERLAVFQSESINTLEDIIMLYVSPLPTLGPLLSQIVGFQRDAYLLLAQKVAEGGRRADREEPPPAGREEEPPMADREEPQPTDREEPPPTDREEPQPTDREEPPPTDREEPQPTGREEPPPTDREEPPPTDREEPQPTGREEPQPTGRGAPPEELLLYERAGEPQEEEEDQKDIESILLWNFIRLRVLEQVLERNNENLDESPSSP